MHKARKIVDWGDKIVEEVYSALGVTSEAACSDTVFQWLKKQPKRRAAQRLIVRAMKNQYRSKSVMDALMGLRNAGVVASQQTTSHGMVWWVIAG